MYKYDEKWEVRSESDLLNESDYLSDRWINLPTIDNLTFFAQLVLLLIAWLIKIDCDPLNLINQLGKLGSLSLSLLFFSQKKEKSWV